MPESSLKTSETVTLRDGVFVVMTYSRLMADLGINPARGQLKYEFCLSPVRLKI